MADLERLGRDLEEAEKSQVLKPKMQKHLGQEGSQRLAALTKEGLHQAHSAVTARARHREVAPGGVNTACAIFDGLRLARRGVLVTLADPQATALTEALQDLGSQVEKLISAAQNNLGAATSLEAAAQTIRGSGLEGVAAMVETLEESAKVATKVKHDVEDPPALELAGRMRKLEVEVRPLIEPSNPMVTKSLDKLGEDVLWETRMVDVGSVMLQTLQDVRAEVGGWAICADAAAELLRLQDRAPSAAMAAERLKVASARLCDKGLHRCGAESLHAVRAALAAVEEGGGDGEPRQLVKDVKRWLAEFVGAAAVVREASEHRVPACESVSDAPKKAVQTALQAAAQHLDADKGAKSLAAAGHEFQKATAAAKDEVDLAAMLQETDKTVTHILGVAWSTDTYISLARAGNAESRQTPGAADFGVQESDEPRRGELVGCCALA